MYLKNGAKLTYRSQTFCVVFFKNKININQVKEAKCINDVPFSVKVAREHAWSQRAGPVRKIQLRIYQPSVCRFPLKFEVVHKINIS